MVVEARHLYLDNKSSPPASLIPYIVSRGKYKYYRLGTLRTKFLGGKNECILSVLLFFQAVDKQEHNRRLPNISF